MKDLLTGEEFEPKRITQRFARKANQTKYNNLKASRERQQNKYIDDKLRTNKRVLDKLMKGKTTEVFPMLQLERMGYHFNVINHIKVIDRVQYWAIYKYRLEFDNAKQTIKIFIHD
jgi:hypothetical protein